MSYEKDGAEIYRQSFATIRAEADLSRFPEGLDRVVVRMIHACGTTDHPGGYRGALEEFYEQAAARLAVHLDAGRDVVVLAEGDPMFYGSYMHMHYQPFRRVEAEGVAGGSPFAAATAT